jgi:Na+-driven multidrug efflux pump
MKDILKIGFPVGIQSILFTIIAVIITAMQAGYGEEVVATQRVGSQIEALAWMIASGFQVALASFVGQNYGAGRIDRVKKGYVGAMKILVPYGIFVSLLLYFFAEDLFGIFIQEADTLPLGVTYLKVLSLSQLFMIIELATAGAFNGLGKTKYPSVVGIAGNFLRIPIAYVLAISLGYVGIWWAIGLSSILKGIVLFVIFVVLLRKLYKVDSSSLEIN